MGAAAMVVVVVLLGAEAAAWEKLDAPSGTQMARRKVEGSSFYEMKAETQLTSGLSEACGAIYGFATGAPGPSVKARKVLSVGPDRAVVYDQVSQPVVSNRDYTMVITKQLTDHACVLEFKLANELGPSMPSGFVRMTKLHGGWRLTPNGQGTLKLVYTMFADPAGSIPAFVVHGPQRTTMLEVLERVREKVAKANVADAGR